MTVWQRKKRPKGWFPQRCRYRILLRAAILKYPGELGCTPAARQRLDWIFVEDDDAGSAPDEEESIEDFAARKPKLVTGG